MKRLALLAILTLLSLSDAVSKSILEPESTSKVNIGFKGGFASTGLLMTDLYVQGHQIYEYESNSQVGYYMSLVTRMTMKRFYLQTEIMPSHIRSAIEFDKNSWDPEATTTDMASFKMNGYYMEIPLLIGYNIIDDEPYSMSLFAGPKITIPFTNTYSTTFVGFGQEGLCEEPSSYYFSWIIGVGYKIGRAFFNFNYNIGLNNISESINYETAPTDPNSIVSMDRHTGVFSFALGVFF